MPQLDGLRCVAVLLVIWEHAGPVWFRVTGGFGVRWFFVLSAYLITGILLRERGAPLGATLQAFYMRRALRILPPYYLLLAAVALSGIPLISGRELAAHALYLSNWWFLTQHWSREIGHLWSLAVEEQFYLVWPALVLMLPTRALPRLFVGSVLVALAWQIGAGALLSLVKAGLATPAAFDAFGAGAWLAWHQRHRPEAEASRARWLDRGFLAGALLIWVTLVLDVVRLRTATLFIPESLAATLTGVWLVDRASRGRAGAWASLPSVRAIGRISYGIYLVQSPIAFLVSALHDEARGYTHSVSAFVLVTALSLAVASVSWRYVEAPINRLKRYFPYE
jgi:peptidoglycan/LPS O-acetylase OafA/YrhL